VRSQAEPGTEGNQALNALVFLYRDVLRMELGNFDAVRARRPLRVPTVLSQVEARQFLDALGKIKARQSLASVRSQAEPGTEGKDKNNKGFLVLLVIVPWIGALSFFLRRRCYPNTSVWRAGSISPLDPIPAPMGHKLYFTFLGALHRVMGMLLAYVILSRTWYAKRVGVPATTLVYDLLDPWSVAPLYESPINAPKVRAHGSPPRQVPWRVFPGVGALLSFIPLAWCGTLETNTRRNWTPGT
jgi:hypothetical protein